MGSVRTILASLFTALGGFFLVAATLGVGFALYLATAPDSVSAPAVAESVSTAPLVRAQSSIPASSIPSSSTASSSMPAPIRMASASQAFDARTPADDRSIRVRQLQQAFARAGCYSGQISGIWNDASKDAMRGFVRTANASLPVDTPDEALIALVESNDTAICAAGRAIETGSLGTSLQPSAEQARAHLPSGNAHASDDSAPTMLGRAWAPAAMLVPAKSEAPAEVTANNDASATENQPPPQSPSTLHFEGGAALPASQPADPVPTASKAESEPRPPVAAKPKKSKTARRPAAKYDDVETSIGKGFDSLQRSISSIF